ncbi:MAG: uroporphyrinogen decarboxylase family protein [Candidatus Sumerlaeia bacterium]
MNDRQRFLNTMQFLPTDRFPWRPQGFWNHTIARWRREGMPADISPQDYFGFEKWEYLPVNVDMIPKFDEKLVEDHGDYWIIVDEHGITKQALKEGESEMSMPEWLDFPVKTIDDFREMKKRYNPDDPTRYPADWDARVATWKDRETVLGLDLYHGLYMTIRQWIGPVQLLYAFYENPALIQEMLEFYTDYLLQVLRRAVEDVDLDYVSLSEDMAYKAGPFISPDLFRQYFVPCYRRLADFFQKNSITNFVIDSDGDPRMLIPPLLESGVRGIHPCEVAAGMDVRELRREYGKDLILWCGIDKRVLAQDRAAIEKEVMAKIPPLIEEGGYIPQIDHSVPPDVPFENFCYYWDLLRQISSNQG